MLHGTLEVAGRTAAWWFTERGGGESASPYLSRNLAAHVGDDPAKVRANRDGLERTLGVGALSWMGPVHGIELAELETPCTITPNVDALATSASRVPLTTLGADCVPMLVAAGDHVIAAHVGWRGLADGMTSSVLRHLAKRGIDPAGARVLLGPAICGTCYTVAADRAEVIEAASPEALHRLADGGWGADIRRGLTAQWSRVGAAVQSVGGCTAEDARYFSHRRDGITGRQAGVIAWLN